MSMQRCTQGGLVRPESGAGSLLERVRGRLARLLVRLDDGEAIEAVFRGELPDKGVRVVGAIAIRVGLPGGGRSEEGTP